MLTGRLFLFLAGADVQVEVRRDSTSARQWTQRRGIGRLRHVDVRQPETSAAWRRSAGRGDERKRHSPGSRGCGLGWRYIAQVQGCVSLRQGCLKKAGCSGCLLRSPVPARERPTRRGAVEIP